MSVSCDVLFPVVTPAYVQTLHSGLKGSAIHPSEPIRALQAVEGLKTRMQSAVLPAGAVA